MIDEITIRIKSKMPIAHIANTDTIKIAITRR